MSNPNRSKVLLGFGAIVAVAIVAVLFWPSNVAREDASGAIGAVQKHHAPQIAQQDVILGGESVKRQQQLLSTDFLADAAKLRSISSNRDVAAARLFEQELAMRYMRAAREAADAASRLSGAKEVADFEAAASRLSSRLSSDEMQAFNKQLGIIAILIGNDEQAMSRLSESAEALASINLADEQLSSKIANFESAMSRVDYNIQFSNDEQYLSMMEMESRVVGNEELAQRASNEFELAAKQLEARATQNVSEAADREQTMSRELGSVLNEIQAAESRVSNKAGMMASEEQLSARLGQLAQRLNQRQTASAEIMSMRASRSLDARSQ